MTLYRGRYRIESARLVGWDYTRPAWYFVTLCTRQRACVLGEVIDGRVRLSPIGRIVAEEWRRTPVVRENVRLDAWVIMPNHLHGIIRIMRVAPRVGSAVNAEGDAARDALRSDAAATDAAGADTAGVGDTAGITDMAGVTDMTGVADMAGVVETPRRGVSTANATDADADTGMGNPDAAAPPAAAIMFDPSPRPRLDPGSLGAIIGQFKSACTRRIRVRYPDFAWQARFYDSIIRDPRALERVRRYIANNPARWARDRDNPAGLFI